MSNNKGDRGGCSVITIVAIGLALLPVLYFLSSGPVVTLINHGLIPMWVAEMLLTPLERLGLRFPAFQKLLQWYGELWNW